MKKLWKNNTILTILLTVIFISITAQATQAYDKLSISQYNGSYTYICDVDYDGVTKVIITYESYITSGKSWFLVPKNFTKYTLTIVSGSITHEEVKRAYTSEGEEFTFYDNFTFTYIGNPNFQLKLNYTMDNGALIVEPQCFFYSPQIYFNPSDTGIAYIYLPGESKVSGGNIQPPPTSITSEGGKQKITIKLQTNSARIAIEYTTSKPGNFKTYKEGIFEVTTPERYMGIAENIIKTYKTFYNNLTKIFNVNLTSVKVVFFAPRMVDLGTGGYTPFNGTHLGNIYLNLLYTRTAQGFWEQIAIHELIHHFAWAAGISPNILWLHEGLAEYLSINLTLSMGWTGASSRMQTLEEVAKQLNGNYGFVQWWNPMQTPSNVLDYYAASYMIVKTIVEENGGISFLQKLFREINGETISDTDTLIHYMNMAAGRDLTLKFISFGFKLTGESEIYRMIVEAKYALMKKSWAQPFAFIANWLLNTSINMLSSGNTMLATVIGWMGIFISMLAVTLTVALWGGILMLLTRRMRDEDEL
jgi:hypothetical protein